MGSANTPKATQSQKYFFLLHLLGADEVGVLKQITMRVSGHRCGRRRKEDGKEPVAWTVGDRGRNGFSHL